MTRLCSNRFTVYTTRPDVLHSGDILVVVVFTLNNLPSEDIADESVWSPKLHFVMKNEKWHFQECIWALIKRSEDLARQAAQIVL